MGHRQDSTRPFQRFLDLAAVVAVVAIVGWLPVPSLARVPVALVVIGAGLVLAGPRQGGLGLGQPASWRRALASGAALGSLLLAAIVVAVIPLLRLAGIPSPDLSVFDPLVGDPAVLALHLTMAWTIAAFGEEIVFRGFLLQRIESLIPGAGPGGTITGVGISAVLFGLAHGYQGGSGMVIAGLAGLLFGSIFVRNGRCLWPLILAHGLMDSISFIVIFAGAGDWLG
ncbi:MAG: lysostaphin resistance A-like protein [Acidobacteriota bacterium]